MNWDELASPESPILPSDSLIGSRQPSQTSMDFREGVTMQRLLQSACCSCVRLRARHPFVPGKSRSAPPRAIVAGAKPARSCSPCSKRPRARHMLRRRRNVSSVTGDRALRDNPTLPGRPIVLLHRRSIVLVGMADTMLADVPEGRFRFCGYRFRHAEARSRSCPFGSHDEF
jgi:hypothetical protein